MGQDKGSLVSSIRKGENPSSLTLTTLSEHMPSQSQNSGCQWMKIPLPLLLLCFIAQLVLTGFGTSLWPIHVSCPSCVSLPSLAHHQPTHREVGGVVSMIKREQILMFCKRHLAQPKQCVLSTVFCIYQVAETVYKYSRHSLKNRLKFLVENMRCRGNWNG